MKRFPDHFLDELRKRAPIEQIIGRRVNLERRGDSYVGLCPFHQEKTPSFRVTPERGFFHCFGCKASGTAVQFLTRVDGLSFSEAVRIVAREAGMALPDESDEDRERRQREQADQERIRSALALARDYFVEELRSPRGEKARTYLESRGIRRETVETFGLGYAPPDGWELLQRLQGKNLPDEVQYKAGLTARSRKSGRAYPFFRDRLVFPVEDRQGRTVAFGGRTLANDRAKYLNSRESSLFSKKQTLFNLHRAREACRKGSEKVYIVEGYMDVLSLVEAGFPGAVAPLGTALTEDQVRETWRLEDEPVLCMDGDPAGQMAALAAMKRALPLLQPGKSLGFVFLPSGEDPDSLYRNRGIEALREAFGNPRPMVDLAWEQEFRRQVPNTPERRAALKARIKALVDTIKDLRIRNEYQTELAHRVSRHVGHRLSRHSGRRHARREDGPGGGRIRSRLAWDHDTVFEADQIVAERHRGRELNTEGRRREISILQGVINVPGLIRHVDEPFSKVPLLSPGLDELRGKILRMHGRGVVIEPETVLPLLEQGELRDLLDRGVAARSWEARGVTESFTRPDADLNKARDAWEQVVRQQEAWAASLRSHSEFSSRFASLTDGKQPS